MRTEAAERHFGGRAGIVRALPEWTKSAVYQWGDVVPLIAAIELERIARNKKVRVDLSLYKKSGHADLKRLS